MKQDKINIRHFFQDTDFTCGPTSLQMLFDFYGVHVSEKHLQHEAHTSKKLGTRHKAMINTALHHGFFVYANNDSSIEEIEYLLSLRIPPIVHYIEHTENWGHYAVVSNVSKAKIHLADPWFGEHMSYHKDDFIERWKSEDGKHPRWLMGISTELPTLGKTYVPKRKGI